MPVQERARRIVTLVVLGLLVGACGGGGGSSDNGSAPAAQESSTEDPFALPPLEEPKDCPKPATDLELTNYGASWANEKGNRPVDQLERCLAAPSGKPLTIAFENGKMEGVISLAHNVAIYADPSSTELIMKGKVIDPGKSKTYEVDALGGGLYLFKCDLHPNTMKGVLVVE